MGISGFAEHGCLPELNATLKGERIKHGQKGLPSAQQLICFSIRDALHWDDLPRSKKLSRVLHHVLETHPKAARGAASE